MTRTATREKGISFTAEMVRAVIAGRKTQARRPCQDQPCEGYRLTTYLNRAGNIAGGYEWNTQKFGTARTYDNLKSPFGQPGDRLWVKEPYRLWSPPSSEEYPVVGCTYVDESERLVRLPDDDYDKCRSLSRITLKVTDIRVERLLDITEADALAQGVITINESSIGGRSYFRDGIENMYSGREAREEFYRLWDSVYEKDDFRVSANPWVWVCEFEVEEVKT